MVEVVALSNVSDKAPTQNIPFPLQHVPCFFQTSDTLTEIPQRTLWATSLPSNKGGWSPLRTGTIVLSTSHWLSRKPAVYRYHCPLHFPVQEVGPHCAQAPLSFLLPTEWAGNQLCTGTVALSTFQWPRQEPTHRHHFQYCVMFHSFQFMVSSIQSSLPWPENFGVLEQMLSGRLHPENKCLNSLWLLQGCILGSVSLGLDLYGDGQQMCRTKLSS